MQTETLFLYPDRKDVTLTALLWESSPALQDERRPRPALLIFPGGGYHSHAHREADPIAFRFAAMGYQAFILRYSLCTALTSCLYPQPLIDAARAMLCIHEHAANWCVDEKKIGVCGFSAGGHLALLYATRWHTSVPEQCQKTTQERGAGSSGIALNSVSQKSMELLRPALCIAGYPVVDFMGWPDDACPDETARMVRDECKLGLLGTIHPSKTLLDEINPCLHVTALTPPTFLWATAEDIKVPALNTLHMAQALCAARVPVESHIFESGEHGLALACPASAGIRRKVEKSAAQWVNLCEEWLQKRFALPLGD